MKYLLLFLLVLSLLGAGWQAYLLIALIIAFSDRDKRKGLIYLALMTLALFMASGILPPSYPDEESEPEMYGYAYRQTETSFDFYEAGTGRGPILVYYYNPKLSEEELEGRRVELSGCKLVRQKTRNKNGFHIERHILSKGYLYGIRARGVKVVDGLGEGTIFKGDGLSRSLISGLRRYFLSKAEILTPRSRELYEALILGKLGRESELADLSKASGLIHLFVISGLHFSLIFSLLVSLFKALFRRSAKYAYALSLAFSTLYYLVLGGGFGATRAYFSSIFLVHGELKQRKAESLKVLGLVCLIFLILRPWSLEQTGFQLSFLATFFLINVSRQGFMINIKSDFLRQLLLSFFVNLLLSFYLVLNSSSGSLFSFVSITYVGFFLGLFLPLLFLYALLPACFSTLLDILARFIDGLSSLLFDYLKVMKAYRLPLTLHPSLAYLLSAAVLLFFLTYLFIYKSRAFKRSALFFLLSLLILISPHLIRSELEFISYDLRDGEANLIKYGNTALLYDVGNDRELIRLLKLDGVHKIDHLIISHADQDHMGIVSDIYKEFEVGAAYYDDSKKRVEIGDMVLYFDRLEGLYSRNDESLTMRLEYKGTSIYFTGDIQVDGMKHSLKKARKCTILKIPHHGSYTDLTPVFIEAYEPDLALISGGRGKRIKKEPIHKYLISRGLRFYDTMLQGEIRLRFHGASWVD